MKIDLAGKRALVTGSTSGMGYAIAKGLAEAGGLRRFIKPTEVANLVVFLASDQAPAITGATLRVDGGIIHALGC